MTGSQRDWNWSPVEKRIARQAFDRALHLEKESAIREFKERVDRIHTIEDIDELWELEGWLRQRRRSIDDRYDYRYSVLDSVLADFLARGQITEADLDGLGLEKLERIREVAQFFRQGSAAR